MLHNEIIRLNHIALISSCNSWYWCRKIYRFSNFLLRFMLCCQLPNHICIFSEHWHSKSWRIGLLCWIFWTVLFETLVLEIHLFPLCRVLHARITGRVSICLALLLALCFFLSFLPSISLPWPWCDLMRIIHYLKNLFHFVSLSLSIFLYMLLQYVL